MSTQKRGYCQGYHFVSTLDKLPKTVHYAVLEQDSRSYPDPYSDTNPSGTSYISESVIKYIGFDDEAALNDYILSQTTSVCKKKYVVIHVSPVEVELQTTVKIKQ